jgi:hypothetical protein
VEINSPVAVFICLTTPTSAVSYDKTYCSIESSTFCFPDKFLSISKAAI